MNLYATLSDVKTRVGESTTTNDALLFSMLETASRLVDSEICFRHFYAESAARYFSTGPSASELLLDDVLSISALTMDSEGDGTFDGETWTEGDANDFILYPFNGFPKTRILTAPDGSYSFAKSVQKYVKAVGLWGYGDGKSATPYEAAGVTVTVADATTTTITVSADDVVKAGHTILVGLEQMFVSAVGTGTFTAERGVNGTTATAQAGAAANIYRYPKMVEQAVLVAAAETFTTMGSEGYTNEKIGDYSYGRLTNSGRAMLDTILQRYLGTFRKLTV